MAEGILVTTGAPWAATLEVDGLRVTSATFEAGHAIPSHFHDYACLSAIVEGGFYQTFPGVEYECPPGALLVKPPAERHVDRWGTRRSRHVIVEPTALSPDQPGDRVFAEVSFRIDPRAIAIARQIDDELRSSDGLARLAAETLALELIVIAGRTRADVGPSRVPPEWLRRSREYLADADPRALSVGEVARLAGVHPARLAREFRRAFGISPGEYVRQLRLARTRSALERSRDSLSAIAIRFGYADQSHFTRDFKRETGLTPAAYRRLRGGGRG
ncbi:MAG TPA: AraC family transcriptional regulator [Vicinamibacterales bacterium]|nr:AraC family transcriptional regulator [Vicinamibacterales bacterium]